MHPWVHSVNKGMSWTSFFLWIQEKRGNKDIGLSVAKLMIHTPEFVHIKDIS